MKHRRQSATVLEARLICINALLITDYYTSALSRLAMKFDYVVATRSKLTLGD